MNADSQTNTISQPLAHRDFIARINRFGAHLNRTLPPKSAL